jgi:hypothetical protein
LVKFKKNGINTESFTEVKLKMRKRIKTTIRAIKKLFPRTTLIVILG